MGFRPGIKIYESKLYAITSYGNGAAYVIVRKRDNASVYIGGDDAQDFGRGLFFAYDWNEVCDAFDDIMCVNIHEAE